MPDTAGHCRTMQGCPSRLHFPHWRRSAVPPRRPRPGPEGARALPPRSPSAAAASGSHGAAPPMTGWGKNIPEESLYVKCNGRLVSDEDELQSGLISVYFFPLEGFGSMLRALGAQIEKTTNREACRDLSGRRLRDVNHEKAMAEWVKKQAEREAEKEQRRLERLQRKLAEPRHTFTDPEYERQYREMAERQEESLRIGLQVIASKAVSSESGKSRKRPGEPGKSETKSEKRKCPWPGLDEAAGSGCEDDNKDDSPCTSDRSCPSGSSANGSVGNSDECSSSSVASAENSPSTSASEKPLEQPEGPGRDLQGEVCTGGQAEILSEENSKMTEAPKEDTQGENGVTQAQKEEQENVPAKAQETNQSQSTEVEPIDLLAFNSAAELEALGLEKLKMGLMSLGLKCGGTLKERAARLFSVRGLSRDQIKPSLFAKPPKGKTSS
ncbi:replication stress response regulator SDE2 [Geospiza fortis]|uniref:Replication stress response regulator SDE2 n=1 Tax=Geospiza fortis TaxID=48883 RepID=A0A8N5I1K7_GEOFO|nr:replication stress response regulator SDE2 [Geospiza fortis]